MKRKNITRNMSQLTKSVALIISQSCVNIANSYVIYKRELVRSIPQSKHTNFLGKMATVDVKISSLEAEIAGYVRERAVTDDEAKKKQLLDAITASRLVLKGLFDQKAGELSFILHLQISP